MGAPTLNAGTNAYTNKLRRESLGNSSILQSVERLLK